MNYYDGSDNNSYYNGDYNQTNNFRNRSPKKRNRGYFLSGLIGSIIGGLFVLLIAPHLINNRGGDLSIKQSDVNGTNTNGEIQQVSFDVETGVTEAVEQVADAVVGVTNLQGGSFWAQAQEAGTGSGVVYKKQGDSAYIVTNHHVIEGANQLEVTLSDGTKVDAELLGSDVWTDLAVIRVDGSAINTTAKFGNSDSLKLGEPVIAIGNPLGLEFAGSITQGIISGLERTVPMDFNGDGIADWNAEVLQTDAAINPGNSGGALVNVAGQVVGINSMKIATQEVEGIGFSIPVNIAVPIIEDIEQSGRVKRPYMGISMQELSDVSNYHQSQTLHLPNDIKAGLLVAEVVQGSPANQSGLKQYDVIVKLDDKEVNTIIDLRKYLYSTKEVGDSITVGFYRNGDYKETSFTLTEDSR